MRYIHKADIRFGTGILRKAHKIIVGTGFRRFAIILDSGVKHNKLVTYFLRNLGDEKIKFDLYENPMKEPSYKYLDQYKKLFKNKEYDCLIGIGGGSTMDLTKGMAVLLTNKGKAIKYKGFPDLKYEPLPVILIPSLPGTGSEIAYNAVFTDSETKTRLGINTELNYPYMTIVEPALANTAPKTALISSTMDCLTHAISSYISPNATPITKALAKEAFRLIYEAIQEGSNEKLYWGSIMANMSLNNAGCGLEASFSGVLGAHFNVPHGIGEGVMLPSFIRLYEMRGFEGFSELYDDPGDMDFVDIIESLYVKLGAPEFFEGVTKKDIPFIMKETKKYWKEAPVTVSEEDIKKILERHTK